MFPKNEDRYIRDRERKRHKVRDRRRNKKKLKRRLLQSFFLFVFEGRLKMYVVNRQYRKNNKRHFF